LDPEAMYIVKNTGTMVIGFPESMAASDHKSLMSLSEASHDEVGQVTKGGFSKSLEPAVND
jgi:hypothetical protein